MIEIQFGVEVDGRHIAEIPRIPGVLAYGSSRDEARRKAITVALRVLADRVEVGEAIPMEIAAVFLSAGPRK